MTNDIHITSSEEIISIIVWRGRYIKLQYSIANAMGKTPQEIIDIPKKSIKCRYEVGEWEGIVEHNQKYVLFI